VDGAISAFDEVYSLVSAARPGRPGWTERAIEDPSDDLLPWKAAK
jgi:hypothetical protein